LRGTIKHVNLTGTESETGERGYMDLDDENTIDRWFRSGYSLSLVYSFVDGDERRKERTGN